MSYSNTVGTGALAPQWTNLMYNHTPSDDIYTYQKTNGDITSGTSGMSISYLASQNGNNGNSAGGFIQGHAPGMFHISFTLGYQWGYSSIYVSDVRATANNAPSSSTYQTSGFNGLQFVNNSSNNHMQIRKHINTTTTLVWDVTGKVEATLYNLWRESDGTVKFRVQGSNPYDCGVMTGDWCFYTLAQSPCKVGLIKAANINQGPS